MKPIVALLIAIIICSTTAASQTQTKGVLYAGGGLGSPLAPSEFTDFWKLGFEFGGGGGILISDQFELTGNVFYNQFSPDDEAILAGC